MFFLVAENQRLQRPVNGNDPLPGLVHLSHGDTVSARLMMRAASHEDGESPLEKKKVIVGVIQTESKSCDVLNSAVLIAPFDWLSGSAFHPSWQPVIGRSPQVDRMTHSAHTGEGFLWCVPMATWGGQ